MVSEEHHHAFLCSKPSTHTHPTIFYQLMCLEESHHDMIRYNLGTFYVQLQISWEGRRIRSICTAFCML